MEYLDVVDENDQVVGRASYNDIYKKLLSHRIVHILIYNDKGEMAIQLRSKNKVFLPLHWSTSVGGHVQAGESFEQAAKRECREEIGAEVQMEFVGKILYEDKIFFKGLKKFLGVFKATSNGPFNINKEEVARFEYFSIDVIKSMIKAGEKFHPELLFLIDTYFSQK